MSSRYGNIDREMTEKGQSYLAPVLYPKVELHEDDIYIIATEGDRYDKLSLQFYGRVDYWWVIMAANPEAEIGSSLVIAPGSQIRIPAEPEDYIVQYQNLNS